jgi:rhodanese-related sulfurtransferase
MVEKILQKARARAEACGLNYAGEVTPREAWEIYTSLPEVRLIDVRTEAEWYWVGVVPGATMIEWKRFPEMSLNPYFLEQLRAAANPDDIVLFLCRAGVRSGETAALAAANGYQHAFNILEGFEGDKDASEQRGKVNGWRAADLPWKNL